MASLLASAGTRVLSRLHRVSPSLRRYSAELVTRGFEELTYERIFAHGFRPAGIVDVGAFRGDWTRMANRVFGTTPTLMVEAQPAMHSALASVHDDLPNAILASAALGARSGEEVSFYVMGSGSSMLPESSDAAREEIKLVTHTLDEVAGRYLPELSPLFLKIDVQGAELHVLRGGRATLARAEVVQLEIALLQYNQGAPLLPEVIAFMAERDFTPIEVSGFSRLNGYLVQIDLLFARTDSALRPDFFRFN